MEREETKMKKVVIIMLSILMLCSCGMSSEDYKYELGQQYENGYYEGYKEGYRDCFNDISGSLDEYIEEIEDYIWNNYNEEKGTYAYFDEEETYWVVRHYLDGEKVSKEDLDGALDYMLYFYESFIQYYGCQSDGSAFYDHYGWLIEE